MSYFTETKTGYEGLYRHIQSALCDKVRSVKQMEKELKWLTVEYDRVEKAFKDISSYSEKREQDLKKLFGDLMDIDIKNVCILCKYDVILSNDVIL